MKRHTSLFTLCLLFMAPTAFAQNIVIEDGAGNIAAMLAYDADKYATSMIDALAGRPAPSGKVMRNLRAKLRGTTLAIVEYTPPKWPHPVKIHARSGRSNASMLEQLEGRVPGSGSETSTGSDTDPGASFDDPGEVARDAAEARWYPGEIDVRPGMRPFTTPVDVRAPLLSRLPDGVVESHVVDDMNHASDAELKALRKLEHMFAQGLPKGGTLQAYVSKTVCPSCEMNFNEVAKRYGVSGKVFQLNEVGRPNDAILGDVMGEDITVASRASSSVLQAVRKGLTDERLGPTGRTNLRKSWFEAADLDKLEAAERGSLTASESCGD